LTTHHNMHKHAWKTQPHPHHSSPSSTPLAPPFSPSVSSTRCWLLVAVAMLENTRYFNKIIDHISIYSWKSFCHSFMICLIMLKDLFAFAVSLLISFTSHCRISCLYSLLGGAHGGHLLQLFHNELTLRVQLHQHNLPLCFIMKSISDWINNRKKAHTQAWYVCKLNNFKH